MRLLAQSASLLATGLIVWTAAASSRFGRESSAGVAGHALGVALLALLCSGTIMLVFQLVSARSLQFGALRISLGTARTAVWLAPVAILFARFSPAALCAALVFTISATKLVHFERARPENDARSKIWLRASASAVAVGGQTSMVAVWMGAPLLATALLCASAAEFTWLYLVAGVYRSRKPSNLQDWLLRILLTLILAVGLTIVGRLFGFHSGFQSGGEPDAKERPGPHESVTTLYQPPSGSTGSRQVTDKNFPGVILWPEVKETQRKLTVPLPSSWSTALPAVPRNPSSILFTGQYWMFKPPQDAPPPGSYFRRASPLALSFLTTDQRALSMQAVQKLDHPLDLGCCRAIQVTILNADRYPGTVALELLLLDTQAPGLPFQSLGRRDVLSRPGLKPVELSVSPVTEVLEFPVPRNARIREFDGIQVLFHRAPFRVDRSAKISIEHFTLVPP